MKIVKVDNFDTESVSDKLIAENVDPYWGKYIVELLNQKEGESSPNFFRLLDDSYKLYVYNPE